MKTCFYNQFNATCPGQPLNKVLHLKIPKHTNILLWPVNKNVTPSMKIIVFLLLTLVSKVSEYTTLVDAHKGSDLSKKTPELKLTIS
jgi:hypothetical protein